MAEPIANDWKAIRDRMQQIKSEESASSRPCPRCKDRGWMTKIADTNLVGALAAASVVGHNPNGLPPPVAPEVGFGRGLTNWPSVCVHS
jgi:hypothetical protein